MNDLSIPARAPRPRRASEAGTTVVELMMVLALMGLVLPAVYATVTAVQRQVSLTSSRAAALANGQTAMDRISRALRAATGVTAAAGSTRMVFESASALDVTFYTAMPAPAATGGPGAPARVRICASPGPATTCPQPGTTCSSAAPAGSPWPGCSVLEVITPATGTSAWPQYTGPSTTRVDATNVRANAAVFDYRDSTGAVITPDALASAAGRIRIEQVWVTIATRSSPAGPDVVLTVGVPLANVDYAQAG